MSPDGDLSLADFRLSHSLRLQERYNATRHNLERFLSEPMLCITGNSAFDAALEVLQTEGRKVAAMAMTAEEKKAVETEEEVQETEEMSDGLRVSAIEVGHKQAPVNHGKDKAVNDAFKVLVRNATEEFGFAPRDVYKAVFDLPRAKHEHTAAVKKLGYSELKALVTTFSAEHQRHQSSRHIIAVYPVPLMVNMDGWLVTFKSFRVWEEVMKAMQLEEDVHLRDMYDTFHGFAEGGPLAGRVFEVVAHRILSTGWDSAGPTLQRFPMESSGKPPAFCTEFYSSPSPAPDAAVGKRTRTPVNFIEGFRDVTLDKSKYYVPVATNNPLFDAFTIYHDIDKHTVVVSFFQMTLIKSHDGSAKGYPLIRKILTHLSGLIKAEKLQVTLEVEYVLVCPDDGTESRRWKMPAGWSRKYCGDAFCLRIPIST